MVAVELSPHPVPPTAIVPASVVVITTFGVVSAVGVVTAVVSVGAFTAVSITNAVSVSALAVLLPVLSVKVMVHVYVSPSSFDPVSPPVARVTVLAP